MENLTLSSTTRTALQNFLQIWKQDPFAQQILCITPQNIFICDPQRLDQITDITMEVEEPKVCNKNTKEIQELLEDLTQPLKLIESHPNPFLALTWEKQVENIIKRLQENRKSKKGCIGILEAYYYLGKLLKENISQHDQIKR